MLRTLEFHLQMDHSKFCHVHSLFARLKENMLLTYTKQDVSGVNFAKLTDFLP